METMDLLQLVGIIIAALVGLAVFCGIALSRFFRKVGPEEALVRSGWGGMQARSGASGGIWVIPILHQIDRMDI